MGTEGRKKRYVPVERINDNRRKNRAIAARVERRTREQLAPSFPLGCVVVATSGLVSRSHSLLRKQHIAKRCISAPLERVQADSYFPRQPRLSPFGPSRRDPAAPGFRLLVRRFLEPIRRDDRSARKPRTRFFPRPRTKVHVDVTVGRSVCALTPILASISVNEV